MERARDNGEVGMLRGAAAERTTISYVCGQSHCNTATPPTHGVALYAEYAGDVGLTLEVTACESDICRRY